MMAEYTVDELRRQTGLLAADLPALLSQAIAGAGEVLGSRPDLQHVHVVGSGDSYNAALASREAFAVGDHIGLTVQTPLECLGPGGPPRRDAVGTLMIGVSASGGNPWLASALARARERGMVTVALTCNANSPVAVAAARSITMTLQLGAPCPGIRSYQASVVGLLGIAKTVTSRGADADRYFAPLDHVDDVQDAVDRAVVSAREAAPGVATELVDRPPIVVLGAGRFLGAARHIAAKITEASALPAFGVDADDWWHVHRFGHHPAQPVLLVGEPSDAGGRDLIKRIRARRRVLAPSGDSGAPPAVIAPLTDHVVGGLLAAALAQRVGRRPFDNP